MSSGTIESSQGPGSERNQQANQAASRARLVARLLELAPDLPAFLTDLVTVQAVVVAGTEAAGFVVESGAQSGFSLRSVAHVRPDGADDDTKAAALEAFKELTRPCVAQQKDGAIEIEGAALPGDESQFCLVTLLRNEGVVVAVSAVIARCRDVERAKQRLESMQLVAGYFDIYALRRKVDASTQLAVGHQDVLQYSGSIGTAENFQQSANALCNSLATRTGAVRVSLGWLKGRFIKVKALSHTEQFDKRQELIVGLQRVMEECADQDQPVWFNANAPGIGEPTSQLVTREASAFSRTQGGNGVLSLPLRRHHEVVGALTLEFAPGQPPADGAIGSLSVSSDLLGPQLYDRHENDRWLITKALLSTRATAKMLVGPKHWVGKLVGAGLMLVALGLFVYRPMFRVSAPFQFSTVEKRVLSTPFEGYLGSVATIDGKKVRAGTLVNKGDLLATMETRDLEIQRAKALSEANMASRESAAKLADGKTAEAMIARERENGARAQADLIARQLARAEIRSPVTGEVLKAEVEDRVGSRVQPGEPLFEVAEREKLRVELSVNERDIQLLKPGMKGQVATTALPGDKRDFVVERIVPLGQPKEGQNVFTVYGTLTGVEPGWRPGIAGEGRVDVGPKPLFYHWTHRATDWVRLKLWL